MQVHRHATVEAFLAAAGRFLESREAEHNLLLGICSTLRTTPEMYEAAPTLLTVADDEGTIVAASVRTPPFNQVLSMVDQPEAVDRLVDALTSHPLPGVLGPTVTARRFADQWSAATGVHTEIDKQERIFRLERAVPPRRSPPGKWRRGGPDDRDLIARWLVEFTAEATPGHAPPIDPSVWADLAVASPHRFTYLWENEGEVVSWVGAGGETPHGIRIGPVYTPPALRGRGYASALTAAASQDQLDRGRRFCFLFTDLANRTSNKIYRAIGYRPVCDVDMWRFTAARA